MSSQGDSALDEQFEQAVTAYDVGVQRVPRRDVSDAIDRLASGTTVATPLSIEDVFPEEVITDPTSGDLVAAETGITEASLGIASYGSVVLRATEHGSEPISLFVDRHIVVLQESDIVPDMTSAFEWFGDELRETRDSAIIATGPSATADMGALVQGAHGPKDVEVILVP